MFVFICRHLFQVIQFKVSFHLFFVEFSEVVNAGEVGLSVPQ